MEKTKVYFSCVMDDTYKEFTIDEKDFEEVLRREEFYNNKYISLSPIEKQMKIMDKLVIIRSLKSEGFVYINSVSSLDLELQQYVVDLLSRFKLEETFSLPVDCVGMYFDSMNKVSKSMPNLESSIKNSKEYYIQGVKNTELLEKFDITLVSVNEENNKRNSYRLLDSKEKGKPYFKEQIYIYKNRKIS